MTDLNLESKERFYLFCKTLKRVARLSARLFVEDLELSVLSPGQSVLKLCQEDDLLKYDIDGHKSKDYLVVADNETRIYNIYYGHQMMDPHDQEKEEQQVQESLILQEKRQLLPQLIMQSKIQLPPFTFPAFLNGEMNVVFYELNQKPPTTSNEDYLLMRSWQVEKKLKYVNLGFGNLRERLIETIKDSDSVTFHLHSERQQVNELLGNANNLTPRQFIVRLYGLRGVEPGSLPHDKKEFHSLFCKFIHGKSFPHAFSPQAFGQADENLRSGKCSPVPLFCWSLIKYKRWLTYVLDGKIDLMDAPCCDYKLLCEQIFESALVKSQKVIAGFKEKYPLGSISQEQYKAIVLFEFNKLGGEFSHMDYPQYYQLMPCKEEVRNYFINHTFLDTDIESHCCQLRKAIVLSEKIRFFKHELSHIDKRLINPSMNIEEMKNHFADIMSVIIPSAEISELLWRAFNQTLMAVVGRKPRYFIKRDLRDTVRHIFKQALSELEQSLDRLPIHIIEAYVANQLDELEVLALTSEEFSEDLWEYINELKRVLEIKLKRHPLQQINPLVHTESHFHEMQMQGFKNESDKIGAFNYDNTKIDNLPQVHKVLIHLKAIPEETTVPELREHFNGQEGATPLKWLAGLGDLMVFIKEATSNGKLTFPYQQQWNIAVRCFVKADGSKFNANSLKVSMPTDRADKFIKAARQF